MSNITTNMNSYTQLDLKITTINIIVRPLKSFTVRTISSLRDIKANSKKKKIIIIP